MHFLKNRYILLYLEEINFITFAYFHLINQFFIPDFFSTSDCYEHHGNYKNTSIFMGNNEDTQVARVTINYENTSVSMACLGIL